MIKKTVLAILIFLALVGCSTYDGDNTTDESEKNTYVETEDLLSYKTVIQEGPFGSITLTIPDGWDYELCEVENTDLLSADYGIHISPSSAKEGYIEVGYHSSFGVCGTGLITKKQTIAGVNANLGFYDSGDIWSYVLFTGEKEGVVATTYSVREWESDLFMKQAIDILGTLKFNENDRSGAIGISYQDSWIEPISLGVSAKNISSCGATIVFEQVSTDSSKELSFGDEYIIEKKNMDGWEEAKIMVKGDYGFDSIAHVINLDDKTEYEYDWKWLYGNLEAGEYRIVIPIDSLWSDGYHANYSGYAYFIIN